MPVLLDAPQGKPLSYNHTANFGSGEQAFAHTDLDMASVDRTFDAAKVYAWMIASYLSEKSGEQKN